MRAGHETNRPLHRIRDADAGLWRVLPDEAFLGTTREPESGRGVRCVYPRGRLPESDGLPSARRQARLRCCGNPGNLREGHPQACENQERLRVQPCARLRHQQLRRHHVACEHPIRPREQTGCEGQARNASEIPPDSRRCEDHQQVLPLRPEVPKITAGRAKVLPGGPELLLCPQHR